MRKAPAEQDAAPSPVEGEAARAALRLVVPGSNRLHCRLLVQPIHRQLSPPQRIDF